LDELNRVQSLQFVSCLRFLRFVSFLWLVSFMRSLLVIGNALKCPRIAFDGRAATEKKRQAIAAQAEELPLETKLLNLAENPEAFAGERTNALAAVERLQRRRQDAQGIVLAS
jgi:hypothetical protein